MIKLDVYDFCHGCPEFNPTVTERPREEILTCFNMTEPIEKRVVKGDTIVSCENSSKCFAIANHYIKNQIRENDTP